MEVPQIDRQRKFPRPVDSARPQPAIRQTPLQEPKMIDPMFAAHATQMRAHMHSNRRTAPPGLSRRRFTAMFAGAAAFVVAGISIYRLAKGKPVHNQQPSPFH
jgi:hypothetical protein